MYNMQELCLHFFELVLTKLVCSSIFSLHSSTNFSTNLFLHLQFSYLNTHPNHTIYHIHIHNYNDNKHILYRIYLYQSILYICIGIYHHSNVVIITNTSIQSTFSLTIITNTCIQSTFTLRRFMSFYVSCFISSRHLAE